MGKRMVILGAGESGTGSAVLAKKQGFDVFVSDKGQIKKHYRDVLQSRAIIYEEEGHTKSEILKAEEIIKSPGIPDDADIITKARQLNIPVVSEIEFASRYNHAYTI